MNNVGDLAQLVPICAGVAAAIYALRKSSADREVGFVGAAREVVELQKIALVELREESDEKDKRIASLRRELDAGREYRAELHARIERLETRIEQMLDAN